MIGKLVILFPSAASFYPGMGRALFEAHPWVRDFYHGLRRNLGFSMQESIIYPEKPIVTETMKRLAVFLTSIALYRAWHKQYPSEKPMLTGFGEGLFSAFVCEGSLSAAEGIAMIKKDKERFPLLINPKGRVLDWQNRQRIDDRQKAKQILSINRQEPDTFRPFFAVLSEEEYDAVLEIGPDRRLFSRFHQQPEAQAILCSYWDDQNDPSALLDHFAFSKFGNRQFLLRRLLGLAAASRNNTQDLQSAKEITVRYEALQLLVDRNVSISALESAEASTDCPEKVLREAALILQELFVLKQTPDAEIRQRITELEEETLLPVQELFSSVGKSVQ